MQYYLIPSQHETSSFLGRGPSGFCKRGDEIICLSVRISAPAHSRLEIKLSVRARRREQEARDSRHSQRSTALRPHQQYSAHPVSTRLKARPPPFAIVPQTIPADFTTLVVRVSPLCVPTCIWCTKLGSHTTLSSQIRYTVATDSHRQLRGCSADPYHPEPCHGAQRVRRRRLPTAAHTVPASVCTVADTEVHVASLRRTSESADSQHRRVPSIGRSYDRSPEITAERTRQAVTESHLRRWPSGPLRIVCAETAVLPSKPLRLNLPLTIRWFTGE